MARFYIEIHEGTYRLQAGNPEGYPTLQEAINSAKVHIDDACRHNTVHVLRDVGHAFLQGDGEPGYITYTDGPSEAARGAG